MSFSLDMAKFVKKTGGNLYGTSKAIKMELFGGVIEKTRVDTGRLKGNWQTSTGTPNLNTTERLDPTGSKAKAEVDRTVKGDTVDYMTNNLPYAIVYEEKDAMIASNMQRIERIVKHVGTSA